MSESFKNIMPQVTLNSHNLRVFFDVHNFDLLLSATMRWLSISVGWVSYCWC